MQQRRRYDPRRIPDPRQGNRLNAVEHFLGTAALERHGARPALICGDQTLSYTALAAETARAANALRMRGVSRGDRVLLLMRDTPEFAAAWLGAVHAGAVAVALNTRLSEPEYRHIRADSGARLAIIEDVFARARPDLATEEAGAGGLAIAGASTGPLSWRDALARAAPVAEPRAMRAEDPAFWLYSSGTTGKPKGIIHAHRNLLPAGQGQREVVGLAAGERSFATSKLFFAYALEHGFLGPLATGATAILEPDWPDAEAALALVARQRPAAFFSVPTFYRNLLALGAERLAPFRGVRRFVAAGERLPAQLAGQWRAATGGEILSLYGMSETFCACMITPPGSSGGSRTGKPLAGVDTRLVAAEGQEADTGMPGELWVRHPALALGYANRPEQTASQFRDGWFRTRDMFTKDAEGFLSHQGRSDELVKIAGQWVQPGELEEAVAGDPAIAEAACVQVTDSEGFERLALFVATRGEPAQALAAAGRVCEETLPRFKRPKWIRAVPELPRTATGKVQRFKLRELIERELEMKR
ncbi:MAG TPA: AMP-binding protein [Burkholderiales bacterium]|nr:AMP-binding protein [Burkholderiales bacterium]